MPCIEDLACRDSSDDFKRLYDTSLKIAQATSGDWEEIYRASICNAWLLLTNNKTAFVQLCEEMKLKNTIYACELKLILAPFGLIMPCCLQE